jgi:hypothetical protein
LSVFSCCHFEDTSSQPRGISYDPSAAQLQFCVVGITYWFCEEAAHSFALNTAPVGPLLPSRELNHRQVRSGAAVVARRLKASCEARSAPIAIHGDVGLPQNLEVPLQLPLRLHDVHPQLFGCDVDYVQLSTRLPEDGRPRARHQPRQPAEEILK